MLISVTFYLPNNGAHADLILIWLQITNLVLILQAYPTSEVRTL